MFCRYSIWFVFDGIPRTASYVFRTRTHFGCTISWATNSSIFFMCPTRNRQILAIINYFHQYLLIDELCETVIIVNFMNLCIFWDQNCCGDKSRSQWPPIKNISVAKDSQPVKKFCCMHLETHSVFYNYRLSISFRTISN